MWKCPKCGKEFQHANKSHSCVKYDTVDTYIAGQSEQVQPIIEKVRAVIHDAAPDAVEKISWGMPTFWQGENLIHFCAQQNHLGIYPGLVERIPFAERLKDYKKSKGTIQFPYSKPMDYELIADITRWRLSCVENRK